MLLFLPMMLLMFYVLLDFFLRPSHDIELKSLRQIHTVKIITGPSYSSTFTAKLTAKFQPCLSVRWENLCWVGSQTAIVGAASSSAGLIAHLYYIIHSVETSIFIYYSIKLIQIEHIFITIRFVDQHDPSASLNSFDRRATGPRFWKKCSYTVAPIFSKSCSMVL